MPVRKHPTKFSNSSGFIFLSIILIFFVLAIGRIKLPVSNLAKYKTFLQMFSISILLTGETGNKIINFQDYNAQTIGIILLWLSAFLTLYTGYDYLRKGIDHAISEDSKN